MGIGDEFSKRAIRRIAVDDDYLWRTQKITDRFVARERIVVHFDDDRVCINDQSVSVWCRARHGFVGDRSTATRTVLDDHGWPFGLANVLAEQSRKNVGAAATARQSESFSMSVPLHLHQLTSPR
jgi:hypothetical protein